MLDENVRWLDIFMTYTIVVQIRKRRCETAKKGPQERPRCVAGISILQEFLQIHFCHREHDDGHELPISVATSKFDKVSMRQSLEVRQFLDEVSPNLLILSKECFVSLENSFRV